MDGPHTPVAHHTVNKYLLQEVNELQLLVDSMLKQPPPGQVIVTITKLQRVPATPSTVSKSGAPCSLPRACVTVLSFPDA